VRLESVVKKVLKMKKMCNFVSENRTANVTDRAEGVEKPNPSSATSVIDKVSHSEKKVQPEKEVKYDNDFR
jgi:hypothetical protein